MNLEQKSQVTDWEEIKKLIIDSKKKTFEDQAICLREDIYPKIKQYYDRYKIKFNYFEIPK